uniref:UPAR/Ly6 domain-containing protein n=1 Tax=Canis lupus familiaris TaxID=9615 RepID=A0A8C0SX00_CANLF
RRPDYLILDLVLSLSLHISFPSHFSNLNSGDHKLQSLSWLKIIQCRMCHLQFPGEKCSRGRGFCIATENEVCMTGRIFKKDGTLWLTFMGCLEKCANVDKIKWSIYLVKFRCCRGYDLCNESL